MIDGNLSVGICLAQAFRLPVETEGFSEGRTCFEVFVLTSLSKLLFRRVTSILCLQVGRGSYETLESLLFPWAKLPSSRRMHAAMRMVV